MLSPQYMAGMIDADGHISWRGGRYQAPNVGVTNTDDRLLAALRSQFGGSVSMQRRQCPEGCDRGDGHFHRRTPTWKWHITGYRAVLFLERIRPHLIIKGERADEVMGKYADALAGMERPARRRHHMEKEREAFASCGWED